VSPLNHVSLTVADRERSAAFYAEYFDLTRRLHDDDHHLILGSDDGSVLTLGRFVRVQVFDPDGYRVDLFAF
jgi:catechol 2,3-dioxygenase-like lactoylglutathione lyase family enzyme